MGCSWARRAPPPNTQPGIPGSTDAIAVASPPTVTTYQNNEGSYVLGANDPNLTSVVHPVSGYTPIRAGENTNNQFMSNDILGAQSKIVPPQPPSYSPSPMPTYSPMGYTNAVTPPSGMMPPPMDFYMPSGPSTQEYFEQLYYNRPRY